MGDAIPGVPVPALSAAASAFLLRYPPFHEMEREALAYMAERLNLGYYPEGSAILLPDHVTARYRYVVQRGMVRLAPAFTALLRRSPRFQDFATHYLAGLLRESRRLLKMQFASIATEQQAMGRSLRSLIRRAKNARRGFAFHQNPAGIGYTTRYPTRTGIVR